MRTADMYYKSWAHGPDAQYPQYHLVFFKDVPDGNQVLFQQINSDPTVRYQVSVWVSVHVSPGFDSPWSDEIYFDHDQSVFYTEFVFETPAGFEVEGAALLTGIFEDFLSIQENDEFAAKEFTFKNTSRRQVAYYPASDSRDTDVRTFMFNWWGSPHLHGELQHRSLVFEVPDHFVRYHSRGERMAPEWRTDFSLWNEEWVS